MVGSFDWLVCGIVCFVRCLVGLFCWFVVCFVGWLVPLVGSFV